MKVPARVPSFSRQFLVMPSVSARLPTVKVRVFLVTVKSWLSPLS